MSIKPRPDIFHPYFTLWVPLGFLIVQILMEAFLPNDIVNHLVSENGPHELTQFLLALAGAAMAYRTLLRVNPKVRPFLFGWVLCFALGCSYIAVEEISWGQSFFAWTTPEYWSALNDQDETNLHNVSSWLDQKPKALVLIGIITGGLLMPLLKRYTSVKFPARFNIIYPSAKMMVIAAIIIFVKLVDWVDDYTQTVLWTRGSEIEELYIFYYLLLYIIRLRMRIVTATQKTVDQKSA